MEDLRKEIERKIKHRKIALANMGINYHRTNSQLDVLANRIKETESVKTQRFDIVTPINGSIELKLHIFAKRVLRKIFLVFYGWFFQPLLERQTMFNTNVLFALSTVERVLDENEIYKSMILHMEEEIKELKEKYLKLEENLVKRPWVYKNDGDIDYFAFENRFRGSEENVREIQKEFINYFQHRQDIVLDIGCGRGEFLDILSYNTIPGKGVDVYGPFVQYCKEKGHNVEQADALEFLATVPDNSLGGIMMSHVVEHLEPKYVIELIAIAKTKLKEGACFIMQTPNPQALFTYLDFFVDITHIKPVHFEALKFLFEQAGYTKIIRVNPEKTKFHDAVTQLYGEDSKLNLEQFNYGMNNLNEYLTGCQDYAIVAYK